MRSRRSAPGADLAGGRRRWPDDWESVFAGYRSQVDWPGARYGRELADAFPRARVILTVRQPEDWYRSFAATVAPELLGPPASDDPVAVARRPMQRETIAQQVSGVVLWTGPRPSRSSGTMSRVAPERLLVFDVTQGWGPLCAFLGVREPDTPFPRTNTVREFHEGRWTRTPDV